MSTHNPRRFATPEHLKKLDLNILIKFLVPFKDYLEAHGMNVMTNGTTPFDYELLSSILLNAADDMPVALSDALYLVNEMAADDRLDDLLDVARKNNIPVISSPDITPADIAAQIWLLKPDLLETMHAEILASKPKSFEHFRSDKAPVANFTMPSPVTILDMQKDLDNWFVEHKRGTGCKVISFDQGDRLCLLIRHGKPFRREGSLSNGESLTILYRPESYDVLIYDHIDNELAINGSITKGEKVLYLEVVGRHLFGDSEYFLCGNKYSLEPLMDDKERSLICSDIDGIENIKLTQVKRYLGGAYGDKETIDTKDYFSSQSWDGDISHIVSATFSIFFAGAKRPRTVRIVPPNKAIFERDDDSSLVEKWLKARGFILMSSGKMGIHDEKGFYEVVGCN